MKVSKVLAASAVGMLLFGGVVSSRSGSDLLRSDGTVSPKGKLTSTFTLTPSGGPTRLRFIFDAVTLEPNDKFFGLVGLGDPDGSITDAGFRNDIFSSYQVEVDGVAMGGDRLRLGTPVAIEGETVHFFDVSQQIANLGTHDVIYRFVNKKTLGDCNVDCFPAGIWSFEFVVNIEKSKGGHVSQARTTATGLNLRSFLRGIRK